VYPPPQVEKVVCCAQALPALGASAVFRGLRLELGTYSTTPIPTKMAKARASIFKTELYIDLPLPYTST